MTVPTAHHVGLTVSDLEAAVDFYRSVFDCSVVAEFSVAGDAFETGVGIDDASARFAHLDLGSVRLELVAYDPAGDDRPAAELNESGATHLGVEVDSLDDFYRSLSADVETISEPQTTETGTKICFLRDPDDHLVEVLELDA
ncbi:VOC family protein [Halonotius terrestris]|uniref:VOC family protein n=1 Tax=Halonotius terrestris TaxID=2487750 RepID=A0A8J8PDE3_9EURY|nr:VOC family protein [Halonotius terrestris]TQQ83265.1 VOC family protein [Halonotius terrestris]